MQLVLDSGTVITSLNLALAQRRTDIQAVFTAKPPRTAPNHHDEGGNGNEHSNETCIFTTPGDAARDLTGSFLRIALRDTSSSLVFDSSLPPLLPSDTCRFGNYNTRILVEGAEFPASLRDEGTIQNT